MTTAITIAGLAQLGVGLGVALFAGMSTGCYNVPEGRSAVSTVAIEGAPSVDEDDLRDRIATRETSRLLGIYGFIYDYELFDRYSLRRDLSRIERYMRARGFYDARVRVARVVPDGNKVHVTIEVEEGRPVVVDGIDIVGDDEVAPKARDRLRRAVKKALPLGARLDEDKLEQAQKAAEKALSARGHPVARVERHADVDLAGATARVRFTVTPGPLAHVGPITWKGLDELPEDTVRHLFGVTEGDEYSSDDIDDARQALLDLGVFASVEVALDTSKLEETSIVPLTVTCEVSKLRALLLGGGLQFDSLRTDVHGTVGWQSSNFFGGLRNFDVKLKSGVVLYPTRFPDVQAPDRLLPEERLLVSLRQPAFIESRTTGVIRADYSIYPVLLPGATTQNVLGYHEVRGTTGLDRTFLKHLVVRPEYGLQVNVPFDYIGRTGDVETLLISYLDVFTLLDLRDDPNHTKKGLYVGTEIQVAGGPLQGDASDFRIQPEVRVYVPIRKGLVLASRASVGFLFPFDYGSAAEQNFRNPGAPPTPGSARDYQILFFRGFYSGGPATNRGYPLRGIGPYDFIPFLSPAGQSVSGGGCDPTDPNCRLPTGGLSLWEASLELRVVVSGPFSIAAFADTADVSPFRLDIRLDRPHLSVGLGGRYDTPVGPIRLDVGYRVPGAQFFGDSSFERPPDTLLGLPIALAFGIGEAF